mmetsp:Transcript_179226/g.568717  ORF Transcript_179226/g.568717 Transcript_179226/m.568717 type:complete len:203 (-) Transcript_179226:267-875(-)
MCPGPAPRQMNSTWQLRCAMRLKKTLPQWLPKCSLCAGFASDCTLQGPCEACCSESATRTWKGSSWGMPSLRALLSLAWNVWLQPHSSVTAHSGGSSWTPFGNFTSKRRGTQAASFSSQRCPARSTESRWPISARRSSISPERWLTFSIPRCSSASLASCSRCRNFSDDLRNPKLGLSCGIGLRDTAMELVVWSAPGSRGMA